MTAAASPSTVTIDVIIVTRTRELVLDCLAHLARQSVGHRVFVADNGGNADGTSDAVREGFADAEVITHVDNRGFSRAVNDLVARGSGEVIVLINDDLNVEPQFLERIVAPITEDDRVGMCAGLSLQPGAEEVVDGFGIEVDPTLIAFNRLRHRGPADPPGRLLGPSGGAAAYRRGAWEAAGGFDARLFFYCEDLDLALRMRLAGWDAAAAADARGVHLGGASAGTDSAFQRAHAGFGRGFILRRYGVLRSRHAPRALLMEALTVLSGLFGGRTFLPLTARVAGWRAASRLPRLPIPEQAIDPCITLRESLRRHVFER